MSGARIVNSVMISIIFVALGYLYFASQEGGERRLSGAQISALLDDASVVSESGWRQTFSQSGATDYWDDRGAPSSGRWSVRGDQFCSQWPPSENWACYDMTADPETGLVVWIAEGGTRYEAFLQGR